MDLYIYTRMTLMKDIDKSKYKYVLWVKVPGKIYNNITKKGGFKLNPKSSHLITKGLPPAAPVLIHTVFTCKYSLIASMPFSLPSPESL